MGGETFDVDRGLLQTQAQQIRSVDPSEGQLCVIGDVATKLVCTTHVPEEDWMANLRELIPRLQRGAEKEHAEKELVFNFFTSRIAGRARGFPTYGPAFFCFFSVASWGKGEGEGEGGVLEGRTSPEPLSVEGIC